MIVRFFFFLNYVILYPLFKLFTGYQLEGHENLKGLENSPIIFVSNHASYLDGPISATSLPRTSIYPSDYFPVRFLAAKEYFGIKNPIPFPISLFTAFYVRLAGCIPIKRGKEIPLDEKLKHAIGALSKNSKLWIFPEGRRTKDGRLQKGRVGAFFLHQKTGAAIVPVGITGNYKILSFKTLFGKTRLKVKFGNPIVNLKAENLEQGTDLIMQKISELIGNGNYRDDR